MTTSLGPFIFPTFTFYLALAVVGSLTLAAIGSRRPRRVVVDMGIGALVGGYTLGRLLYAALNPAVFASAPLRLLWDGPGGLDWHGAYVGALVGVSVVVWGYGRNSYSWLLPREQGQGAATEDPSASGRGLWGGALSLGVIALPLIALAGWLGCARVGCLYGAEVETLAYYPAWLVTEGRDIYGIIAPRYATHRFGVGLALGLLVWSGAAWWRGRPTARLFWAQSAVLCAGMFGIGFLRADDTLALPLVQADQGLDLLLLVGVLVRLARSGRPVGSSRAQTSAPPPSP